MVKTRKQKAIWWFAPALLEPCDGPWGRLDDFGHDPVPAWRAIIDWAARLKVDRLIPGIEPYMSDRVYNQWGFHYVCHFPRDPAARCFDDDTIRRNIATVRAIAAYGRERNVGIMFHHYNLMAPERWVREHPALWEKYQAVSDPVWGKGFRNDRLGFLAPNLCWNEPDYKGFMERCWREVFENIPELTGAMITAGEFTFCRCDKCTGGDPAHIFQGTPTPAAAAQAGTGGTMRDQRRGEMVVDLIRTFTDVLKQLGKETIVRSWVVGRWLNRLPRGIEYATKYSVFDACWGGPDPVVHDWLDAGHAMWETLAIEAENCGPVIWHDDAWCKTTAERINALKITGCIIHINLQWGHAGHIGSFTASRNITRILECLEQPASAGDSAGEFNDFFGPAAGPVVYRAARLMATFPLHMTAVVHLEREGFSFGMPPWFDGRWRWPGVLGSPRYQAPAWCNPDGLTGIYELVQAAAARPENFRTLIEVPRGTVIGRCDEIAAWCAQAAAMLQDCPAPEAACARSELRALTASAHIAALAAREHAAILRARVAWEAVKHSAADSPSARAARALAVDWYGEAVEALSRQVPWNLELARVYPDQMHHVVESRETCNRLTLMTRIRIRREELFRIRTVEGPDWDDRMLVEFWPFLPDTIGSGARR